MKILSHDNYKLSFFGLVLIFCLIGSSLIYYTTHWGPWAFSDSAAYISSAKNFNRGLGISLISAEGTITPLEHFPPLYPLTLSILAKLGLEYVTAARILDIGLFGLLILIFTWGIMTLTRNIWLTLASGLLVLFSPVMLDSYGGVMTEALFITLLYTALFFTLIYLQQHKTGWFVLAVLFTSLSPLVRYVGIFTVVVNFLLIILFEKTSWKKRIKTGIWFGFLSSLPIILWFAFTYFNTRMLGARTIIQPADLLANISSFFRGAGNVFQSWLPYMDYRTTLISDSIKTSVFSIAFLLLLLLCIFFYFKNDHPKPFNPILQVMLTALVTIIIYLLVLCGISLFTIPPPVINSRMLSPLLPSLALLFSSGLIYFLQQIPSRWKIYSTILIALTVIILIRYYFLRTTAISKNLNENGYGFTAREIQTSGFLKAVQSLPAEIPLIANTPAMTLFYTNRMPHSVDGIPTNAFGTRDSPIEQLFNTQHAALILEFAPIRNVYPDWETRLASLTHGLTIAYKDDIGGIYYSPGGTTP
jgi:4-amino-4-deoxy-L-arabinose transferase-like glycosyltransferase